MHLVQIFITAGHWTANCNLQFLQNDSSIFFFWKSPLSGQNKHVAVMQWYSTLVNKSEYVSWTGCGRPQGWPPHSPHLILLDVFFYKYMTCSIYQKILHIKINLYHKLRKMAIFIWNSPENIWKATSYKMNKPAYWEWKDILSNVTLDIKVRISYCKSLTHTHTHN